MMSLMQYLIKIHSKSSSSKPANSISGFTMIELIIGAVMAFLIITPLLGFVVSVLNDDQRESAKATTESEVQAALNYIAEDLSQAYYIYDQDDLLAIQGQLPLTNQPPSLVFWKMKNESDALPSVSAAAGGMIPRTCTPEDCDDTKVKALVAYYLVRDQDQTWCQPSGNNCPGRIIRFSIQDSLVTNNSKYSEDDLKDSQKRTGAFRIGFELQLPVGESNTTEQNNQVLNTQNVTQAGDFGDGLVLVNYIDEFILDDVSDTRTVAKFTLRGNALRRLNADAGQCSAANIANNTISSAYCPKATIRVRGQNPQEDI